jgi:hypothetical protein
MANEFFGEEEFDGGNRIYLDIRAGWIAQTKKVSIDENGDPVKREVEAARLEGYEVDHTVNMSGKVTWFLAKRKKAITGYVTDLRFYESKLPNQPDVTLTGIKITIETPHKTYVLQVSSQDRPYSQVLNTLLNADFSRTLRFKGYKKDGKKNLLVYFGGNDNKDYILGKHKMAFLFWETRLKIKENLPLSDKDKENIVFLPSGEMDTQYPYIFQKQDKKWNFDLWEEFIRDQVTAHLLPAIKAANEARAPDWKDGYAPEDDPASHPDIPDHDELEERAAIAEANQSTTTSPLTGRQMPITGSEPLTAAAVKAAPDDDIPF